MHRPHTKALYGAGNFTLDGTKLEAKVSLSIVPSCRGDLSTSYTSAVPSTATVCLPPADPRQRARGRFHCGWREWCSSSTSNDSFVTGSRTDQWARLCQTRRARSWHRDPEVGHVVVRAKHDGHDRISSVLPIVTPEEMTAIDGAAPESVEVLIGRAGAAVAREALRMLGGSYGRRVVVVVGRGNNGADGRAAADLLQVRGVRCTVVDAASVAAPMADRLATLTAVVPACDLLIDAAYGTGFRGTFDPPPLPARLRTSLFQSRANSDNFANSDNGANGRGRTRPVRPLVLAVDIPSGVDGLTGAVGGRPWPADRTITFAALKPGLLLEPGASLASDVVVADIGLDTSTAAAHLVDLNDLRRWLPSKPADTHKWKSAVWVIGGSSGMEGAAALTARAAMRAGAGYVRWSAPTGRPPHQHKPVEVVATALPLEGWATDVLNDAPRFGAIVVGNGLGLDPRHEAELRRLVAECPVPVVCDADALTLLSRTGPMGERASFPPTTIVTPHDGEFARLSGVAPAPDRFNATRQLAATLGCTVLLKGPCTIVASPDGRVLAARGADQRLATLGTGDVLAGIIGALVAQGMPLDHAGAGGAVLHGAAARRGPALGLVASDLLDLIPEVLADLPAGPSLRVRPAASSRTR